MSFFSGLIDVVAKIAPTVATMLGGPLAGGVVTVLGGLLNGTTEKSSVTEIITALKDPDNLVKLKQLEQELFLAKLKSEDADKDRQALINLEEAKSDSFWKSGARPAALWISVVGFGYNYLVVPVATSLGFPMVGIPMDQLSWLLGSLLGIGTMRTYEKVIGVKK